MKPNIIQLGARLRQARLQAGLSQAQLARRLGKSKQLASAWEAGRAEILVSTLADFAAAVDVDANWLLRGIQLRTGDGNVARPPQGSAVSLLTSEQAIWNASGKLDLASFANRVYTPFVSSSQAFALEASDASMSPELRRGDIVIVDPDQPVAPGALVAAVVKKADVALAEPTVVIRRVHFKSAAMAGAPLDLIPTAVGWPRLSIRKSHHVALLGTVAAVLRCMC